MKLPATIALAFCLTLSLYFPYKVQAFKHDEFRQQMIDRQKAQFENLKDQFQKKSFKIKQEINIKRDNNTIPHPIKNDSPNRKPTKAPSKPSHTPTPTSAPKNNQISNTPTPTPTTSQPTDTQSNQIQQYIMNEINKYRESHGLSKVATDPYTCSFAKVRAKEISTNFNHDGFTNRIRNNSIPYPRYSKITENLAMTSNYKNVVSMWINSPGHAANMRQDTPYVCVEAFGNYYAYEGWRP